MSFSRLSRAGLALLSLAMLALSACGGGSASTSASLTPIKIALDWVPNTNHTGVYVALQKGYYRAHGLDVTLVPYGSTYPEALVAADQAQFGISFEESVAIGRAQGQPLVSIATVFQHATSAMAVLKSSGITRPAQLAGKRFASAGDPAEKAVISVMLANDGATNTDYQSTLVDTANVSALLTNQFDFVWIYQGVEGVQAKDKNIELNTFSPQDYGVPDFYSPVIISSEKEIKQHPDTVRAFLAATSEGYTYAAQHPQESADILYKGAQAQGGTLFDTEQVAADSQAYQSKAYIADAKCWGIQEASVWTDFPRLLYRNGALVDASNNPLTSEPNYNVMFSNDYLPKCS